MPHYRFDRRRLLFRKLEERKNKVNILRDHIPASKRPESLTDEKARELISLTAEKIRMARRINKPVVLAFGAHAIKNGLSPVLIELIRQGWITHMATNGAGIIHDWELAYIGETSEDVRENTSKGQFGIWHETGYYINLALLSGAFQGLGYGESVGKMIFDDGLFIPDPDELRKTAVEESVRNPERAAAAIDLAGAIENFRIQTGFIKISHPFKQFSVQSAAFQYGVKFTGHPMIGHDIIYTHPLNNGAALGRTALNDFLSFVQTISDIDQGVYMSVGSAIMSPMIFEKALSMAQNIAIQEKRHIDRHFMLVVDLTESQHDWKSDGEPSENNPAYYMRYCKTFSRMGGEMHYLRADNRLFFPALLNELSDDSLIPDNKN
ncbi:MAG: hypothetical protein HPY62_06740 [Bacteroidales bacterium]|nr:hypothetical protein [Bacteroidales bacterium]